MASTYTGRYTGIASLLKLPGLAVAVEDAARKMLPIAEGLSPVGNPAADRHPGQYKASFEVQAGVKSIKYRGRPTRRPYGRLVNTAPHAQIVEYGNGKVQRYAVLSRTLDAATAAHSGS